MFLFSAKVTKKTLKTRVLFKVTHLRTFKVTHLRTFKVTHLRTFKVTHLRTFAEQKNSTGDQQ